MTAIAMALVALLAAAVVSAAPPEFAARDLDGNEVTLASQRGKVVLLNTWATWCHPCQAEMPYLDGLQQQYGAEGLEVIGVNIDAGDADAKVRAFADELGVDFTIWRDPTNRFARTFQTSGVPESLLIGRNGEIVYRWKGEMGLDPTGDAAAIEAALAASPAETPAIAPAVARIALPVAFLAGLLSFLSPCVLPLVPTYAAILTGMSVKDLSARDAAGRERARNAMLGHGLLFVAGFSAVFILMGASATLLGGVLQEHRVWISRIGGVILALLGLHLLGLLRLPFADRDARFDFAGRPAGHAGTFLIGMAFGAGWTPCIGPALAAILTLAATTASVSEGMLLLAVYSLGLAIPFLAAKLALDRFMARSSRLRAWLPRLQVASGVLVLVLAVLLLTDSFSRLAGFFA
jgi:cytochrome c-type biogenesis protein